MRPPGAAAFRPTQPQPLAFVPNSAAAAAAGQPNSEPAQPSSKPGCYFTNVRVDDVVFEKSTKKVANCLGRFQIKMPRGQEIVVSALSELRGFYLDEPNTYGGKSLPGDYCVSLSNRSLSALSRPAEEERLKWNVWLEDLATHAEGSVLAEMPRNYSGVMRGMWESDFKDSRFDVVRFSTPADGHRIAKCCFRAGKLVPFLEDIPEYSVGAVCFKPSRVIVQENSFRLVLEPLSVHIYGEKGTLGPPSEIDYSGTGSNIDLTRLVRGEPMDLSTNDTIIPQGSNSGPGTFN